MREFEEIKKLLILLKDASKVILELEKYNIDDIISVALDNEFYDSLKIIFQPIMVDGVLKIYFDAFSTDIVRMIRDSYDTIEDAQIAAREEYEDQEKYNREMSDEDRELLGDRTITYEEILSSKRVIPKSSKEDLLNSLYSLDFELLDQVKIKNSHARQISGIAHPVTSINDVIYYSEPACVKTCIDLFNKNIQTTMNDTEGVIEDLTIKKGVCCVHCNYDSLSPENKAIAEELIDNGYAKRTMDGDIDTLSIFVPCKGEETIGEVSRRLQAVVSKFAYQDVLYGVFTVEGAYERFTSAIHNYSFLMPNCFDDGYTPDALIKFLSLFGYDMIYDEEEGLIWESKVYYEKHKKYLENHEQDQLGSKN